MSVMQDRPVCFECDKKIENNGDMVFEAPCGHVEHSSAVFHGVCLMEFREKRTQIMERIHRMMQAAQECTCHEDSDGSPS